MVANETKLHPIWKQAVKDFLAADQKPGDVVTRPQLEKWFEMRRPARGTYEEIRDYELKFLATRDRFADELLRKHQIQFGEKDRDADGWRVLAPGEVAKFTRKQSEHELKKALRRQRERLAHTDLSGLTPEQQRDHAETLVRNSWKLRAIKDTDKRAIELPALPMALPRRTPQS
jgi:hypothetical protein